MPSPFPGMDPYLEGDLWTSVHAQLSVEIARQLTPKLRPRYLALTNERFVPDVPEGVTVFTSASLYPDIGVSATGLAQGASAAGTIAAGPLQLATALPSAVPHVSVEIRDRLKRQLVTVIEVLSPTNKRGEGRVEYLAKRQDLLLSSAHLVEIDLLRQGHRVPMEQTLPSLPYFVFVSRVEKRPILDVWPITFQDHLPTVPVPLLSGDADVTLDLQLALTNVYDLGGYDLAVDYTKPPESPLPADAGAWADEKLRAAGLRT